MIVKYEYDAWGKVLAETDKDGNPLTGVAATWSQLNPFRYRGYYYDAETQLYYLQSRYYDAEVGRFLNSDAAFVIANSPLSNFDKNFYSYCDNNPINRVDYFGSSWGAVLLGAGIGAASWYASELLDNWQRGVKGAELFVPDSSWGEFIGATISGMMPGRGFGGALLSSLTETSIVYFGYILEGEDVSLRGYLVDVAISTAIGTAFDKGADWINNKIDNSILPRNYSTYAGEQYKKYPGITSDEVKIKLGRLGKWVNAFEETVSSAFDVLGSAISSVLGG